MLTGVGEEFRPRKLVTSRDKGGTGSKSKPAVIRRAVLQADRQLFGPCRRILHSEEDRFCVRAWPAVSPRKIRCRYTPRIFVLIEEISSSLECPKSFPVAANLRSTVVAAREPAGGARYARQRACPASPSARFTRRSRSRPAGSWSSRCSSGSGYPCRSAASSRPSMWRRSRCR
jgi:hypothetical protein